VAQVAGEAGVIGIGIGGSEQLFPPEPFAAVYARARELGLRTTAHAGEVAGPESVWGAIRALRADRIDHGLRAVEDPALVTYLAERRLPVTACPGSNLATGAAASLESHPIRRFLDAGLLVSVSTDDPAMFGAVACGGAGVRCSLAWVSPTRRSNAACSTPSRAAGCRRNAGPISGPSRRRSCLDRVARLADGAEIWHRAAGAPVRCPYRIFERKAFVRSWVGELKTWSGVPSSTTTPSSIMTTRLATSRAKPIS